MKQFIRHKTSTEILAQCIATGGRCDASAYNASTDHITVWLPGPDDAPVPVLYNTINGRFFYAPSDDSKYFSSDEALDGQPWFDAMMEFFYTDLALEGASGPIPVTLHLSEDVVRNLFVVVANCNGENERNEGCTSHGELDIRSLLQMLAEDAAMTNSRPGSWEGANMQQVLDSHGYR